MLQHGNERINQDGAREPGRMSPRQSHRSGGYDNILRFQAAAGNRATGRLIRSHTGVHGIQRAVDDDLSSNLFKKDYWKEQAGGRGVELTGKAGNARSLKQIVDGSGAGDFTVKMLLGELAQRRNGKVVAVYKSMRASLAEGVMNWKGSGVAEVVEELLMKDYSLKELRAVDLIKERGLSIPIGGHLGDQGQAQQYLKRGGKDERMLRFTLKPGAYELMFDPRVMALGKVSNKKKYHGKGSYGAPEYIAGVYSNSDARHPLGSGNEGNLAGYIGAKKENPKDGGEMSIAVGASAPSHLIFQLLVQSIDDVTDQFRADS